MKEKTSSPQYALLAGILFGILALRQLVFCVQNISVLGLLWFVAYAATTAVFILKKREQYAVIPFALLTLLQLWSFIMGLKYHNYVTWGYYEDKFSPYVMFVAFLLVAAYLAFLCLVTANFTSVLQGYKETINKLWFIPAALMAARIVLSILGLLFSALFGTGYSPYYASSMTFVTVLYVFALLPSALWIAYPDGLAKKEAVFNMNNAETTTQNKAVVQTTSEAYCGLVKHILLLLFTFGIWHFIWIYKMTGYTNAVQNEEHRNPTNKLLLCLFVPFYVIYWTYKTAQRVDKMAAEKGISSDLSTLCLILEIFVPIIPPILLQEKMNSIVTADDVQPMTYQSNPKKDAAALGTAEELKTFKELLDSGVITQEEFDAKKKQLLGL